MPIDGFSDLATVQRWIHEVARETRSQEASTAHSLHHMRLRSKTDKPAQGRQPLGPTSGNQLRRKQALWPVGPALNPEHQIKRRKIMDKGKQPEEIGAVPEKRGRGRPKKTPQESVELSHNAYPQLEPAGESSESRSSQSKPPSPRKAGKPIDQLKADAAITMQDLGQFVPSVIRRDLRTALLRGNVPEAVTSLYNIVTDVPRGFIPKALKVGYFCRTSPVWTQWTNPGAVGCLFGKLSDSQENKKSSSGRRVLHRQQQPIPTAQDHSPERGHRPDQEKRRQD